MSKQTPARQVAPGNAETCPMCGAPTANKNRPFCSARCANIDLNRWLSGAYAIPVVEDEDEDGGLPGDLSMDAPGGIPGGDA